MLTPPSAPPPTPHPPTSGFRYLVKLMGDASDKELTPSGAGQCSPGCLGLLFSMGVAIVLTAAGTLPSPSDCGGVDDLRRFWGTARVLLGSC